MPTLFVNVEPVTLTVAFVVPFGNTSSPSPAVALADVFLNVEPVTVRLRLPDVSVMEASSLAEPVIVEFVIDAVPVRPVKSIPSSVFALPLSETVEPASVNPSMLEPMMPLPEELATSIPSIVSPDATVTPSPPELVMVGFEPLAATSVLPLTVRPCG